MADAISDILDAFGNLVKEILAIISNIATIFSIFWAIIGLLSLVSQQGLVQGYISWLALGFVSSIISGLFAEILNSSVPTPFKWLVELVEDILEILGQI